MSAIAFEPSLGRETRLGSFGELARGTFDEAKRAVAEARLDEAVDLIGVSVLEAEELRDVYDRWPDAVVDWLHDAAGISHELIDAAEARLSALLGHSRSQGIAARWPDYLADVEAAQMACRFDDARASELIERAYRTWHSIHDQAVDLISGMIDLAVRLAGERRLGDLWDVLMADWYDAHEARYSLENQPWSESVRQLTIAIFDGFHAHLTGIARSGEIEVIEQPDRIGFRFAPCGSGGRSVSSLITDGTPRAGAPFDFAVTTEPHDWAWNKVGICSYCVHCCKLNEITPIDRIGYPTRVIDAPIWPTNDAAPSCTWWIYRDPSLVPDEVYARVGRRRPPTPARGEDS